MFLKKNVECCIFFSCLYFKFVTVSDGGRGGGSKSKHFLLKIFSGWTKIFVVLFTDSIIFFQEKRGIFLFIGLLIVMVNISHKRFFGLSIAIFKFLLTVCK